MKKKLLMVLIIALVFTTTACSKTDSKTKQATKQQGAKQEVKEEYKEEKVDVAGTYFVSNENDDSLYYNDYLTLNEDKSFDRQANYCAGIRHLEGTYEVKKEDNKILIEFKVNEYESLPIQAEYKDNKIIADSSRYVSSEGTYNAILNLIYSCNGGQPLTFYKDDSSKIDYVETVYGDIGPR